MSKPSPREFLILGLPRSRTAWLANLFTVPPLSFCLHEGLSLPEVAGSWHALATKLRSAGTNAVGLADTGAMVELDTMLATFPKAALVVLVGGDASWRKFVAAKRIPPAVVAFLERHHREACDRLRDRALFFDVREIGLVAKVFALWRHCVGPLPFDADRLELLRELNVQAHPEALGRRVSGLVAREARRVLERGRP